MRADGPVASRSESAGGSESAFDDDEAADGLAPALRMAILRLVRQLRQQDAPTGLTISQLSALSVVAMKGEITLGELAAAERVQPPTMTRVAASLESQGLVERISDVNDRRIIRLRPTDTGLATLTESRSRRTAYLALRLRELSGDDREVLSRSLPILEELAGEI